MRVASPDHADRRSQESELHKSRVSRMTVPLTPRVRQRERERRERERQKERREEEEESREIREKAEAMNFYRRSKSPARRA